MINGSLVLFFLLLSIGIVGYSSYVFNGRKLYSPSFLLNAVFFFCTFFAFIGNVFYWHEEISLKGPIIILLSLCLITVLEFLISKLLNKTLFRNKQEQKPVEKFSLGTNSKILLITASIIGIIVNVIYFVYCIRIAVSFGYKPMSINLTGYLRTALFNGASFPVWLSLLNYVVRGFGLACVYYFVYSIFTIKKKQQLFLFLIPLANLIVSFFLTTARDVFILVAVVATFSFLMTISKRQIKLKASKFILILFLVFAGFLFIYFVSGFGRNNSTLSIANYTSNFFNIFCRYTGSAIIAFDKWLRQIPYWQKNAIFGEESFSSVYYILNKFFKGDFPTGTTILEFTHLSDGGETNIYTMFRSFCADFGVGGNFLVVFFIGVFYGTIASIIKKSKENSPILLYSGIILYYLLYGAFTPIVTTAIFGSYRTFYILFGLLSFWLINISIHGFKYKSKKNVSSFKRNVSFALIAEATAVIVGASVSLLLPKFVSDEAYSYYHLFTFYIGYVGLAHLGYCDGVYLRFGGKTANDFKNNNIKTQLIIFAIIELVFALFTILSSLFFIASSWERSLVLVFVGLYLFIYNSVIFVGYIFQDINQTEIYSKATIIAKVFLFISLIALFVLQVKSPFFYIACFVIGYLIALIFMLVKGRKFLFGRPELFKDAFKDMWISLKCGVVLLFAGLSNAMILGITRYVIDWHWGLATFGKLSFSLSLVALISAFFTSFSLVLFPSLRLKNNDSVDSFFKKTEKTLSILLPLSYLAYFIIVLFVKWWLPTYSESLVYFSLLLPSVIFNAKYTILSRTAMNVDRQERRLLITNLIAMFSSIVLTLISAFILNNITLTILSSAIGSAVLSVTGQLLSKRGNKKEIIRSSCMDLLLGILFVISNYFTDTLYIEILITSGLLMIYYLLSIKNVVWFFKNMIPRLKRKKE